MRPLFPYFGGKWRSARRYPHPIGPVVEPFAGSAGYSVWWEPAEVALYDVDPIIVGVWDYLIRATAAEILALPDLEVGERIDDHEGLPQEARWLIGFWTNPGSAQPKQTMTAFGALPGSGGWSERLRQRIAGSIGRIRGWTVEQIPYHAIDPTPAATWFVDPPYAGMGKHYRYADVDHARIGRWARSLPGQVIVCEAAGADWLPFSPLTNAKARDGHSLEVVYTQGSSTPSLF